MRWAVVVVVLLLLLLAVDVHASFPFLSLSDEARATSVRGG